MREEGGGPTYRVLLPKLVINLLVQFGTVDFLVQVDRRLYCLFAGTYWYGWYILVWLLVRYSLVRLVHFGMVTGEVHFGMVTGEVQLGTVGTFWYGYW